MKSSSNHLACLICEGKTKILYNDLYDDRYGAIGWHAIYQCRQCGFGRTIPGLEPNQIGSFYASHYPLATETSESVKKAARIPSRWLAWLTGTDNIAHHQAMPNTDVLDIGSASGISLLEIEQRGARAHGVEPDPNSARIARELKLNVHNGFITDNPFPGVSFDLITASQVIEHSPDPRAFLEAIADRLKPNGRVILSFPNLDAFYQKIFRNKWLHWHVPYHLNFFTRRSFTLLAEQAGFSIQSVRTITPNLWTILQLKSIVAYPKEGEMGRLWAAQHGQNHSKQSTFFYRIGSGVSLVIAKMLILLLNRPIDVIGSGESFLVVLIKKNDIRKSND